MASEAAMRAGAGLRDRLVPASLNLIFEIWLLEVMTVPLADRDGRTRPPRGRGHVLRAQRARRRAGTGPGLGRAEETHSSWPARWPGRSRFHCCSTLTG